MGHYAPAFVAKALVPDVPLLVYMIAVQFLDLIFVALVGSGVEVIAVDPSITGFPADLQYVPYSHSLPMAFLWSLVAGLGVKLVAKYDRRQSLAVGLAVLSHWFCDLLVHYQDLSLFWYSPKVGCGMWKYPIQEVAFEAGWLGVGAIFWTAAEPKKLWSVLFVFIFLIGTQCLMDLLPFTTTDEILRSLTTMYYAAAFVGTIAERFIG